jgi:hypothetical protein
VVAALILTVFVVGSPAALPDSTRQAEREARSASYRYERVLVTSSPQSFGGGYGDRCDERIGRFCFWHGTPGTPRRPIEPDPPEVEAAREDAIHAFRRWFALAPAELRAAGPLVRYLIESDRASEAVAAARAHVWADDGSPASLLVLGLALHYARDFAAAEAAFDRARSGMRQGERRQLDDLSVLLAHGEHSRYRGLSHDARAVYEDRFWALSDPWYMDAGNERRSAHYARHALSRIHALAPRVEGRMSWGRDHEELLIRYGLPTGRQRVFGPSTMAHRRVSLVEYFDPRRVALSPEELMAGGVPFTLPPGVRPEIERDTVRSHYAPLGIRRTRGLLVQPSVFPGEGVSVIRVDALLEPDTVAPRVPDRPEGLLVVLDTLGREVGRTPVAPRVRGDSMTVLTAEQRVPPGSYVYRVEIRDAATGLAGLAQYRIDVPERSGLTISDLLVAAPVAGEQPGSRDDPSVEAVPHLTLPPGQRVGVYAEVSGLEVGAGGASYGVQWWIERADGGGLLRRAARWVGERIGLLEEERPPRVGWEEGAPEDGRALFVTLDLTGVDPGLHLLGLRVQDRVSGEERTATRLIRIEPGASPLPVQARS